MPTQPTAELITSADKAPVVRMSGGVWTGKCCYRINCADEIRAASALGLPQYGHAFPRAVELPGFDAAVPLWCSDLEIKFTHGSDDPATGIGGWCEATVDYASPSVVTPPVIGARYSEIECTTSSVHVVQGIGDGDQPLIANGKGASKDVGGTLVRVITVMAPGTFAGMLGRLIALQGGQKYNDEDISIPGLQGTTGSIRIKKGWAQYNTFRTEWVGGVGAFLKLTQQLKVAEDGYLVRWRQVDELGNPVTSPINTPIYELADFGGLFG